MPEKETDVKVISNDVELTIQPNDMLDISITSLSPESNVLFNSGVIQVGGGASSSSTGKTSGYLVDRNGYVLIPVIGKVRIAGLTKQEAINDLALRLGKYARDPIVDIKFMNFKITVIGEVNTPSTFNVTSDRINVLEALGLAGDMTPYGKRENVLIIREQSGERITTRIDLNKKEVLNSPFFYLQQNDIVYVEPDKVKAIQVSPGRSNVQYGLSIGLALVSVVTLLVSQVF
ncbi:polysaccharide biosynthesis/export family protein [Pontibacter virosus]|nr:polysaccharide biosynthesis/export family protein [Pontibacter virosus]